MKKYCWREENSDYLISDFDSFEELLQETKDYYPPDEKPKIIYIGETAPYEGVIDADTIIERIQEDACEVNEDSTFLDDATREQITELDNELNKVFGEWLIKYDLKPNFDEVVCERKYDLENEIFVKKR